MKYLDLKDIIIKMMGLNKSMRELVMTENYIIFKHFLRLFTLNKRLRKSDIPAKVNMLELIRSNVLTDIA